jgi:hypothetical protein
VGDTLYAGFGGHSLHCHAREGGHPVNTGDLGCILINGRQIT